MTKRRAVYILLLVLFVPAAVYFGLPGKGYMHRGKTIPEWVAQIEAPDQNPRTEAEAAFREMGARAVPELEILLTTPESPGRKGIQAILRLLPPRKRIVLLQRLGRMEPSNWRSGAAKALGSIGSEAQSAIPELEQAMQDPHSQVRLDAAFALGKIGPSSIPALLRNLDHTNAGTRVLAARILGDFGTSSPQISTPLRKALQDPDQGVRAEAAWALGQTNRADAR